MSLLKNQNSLQWNYWYIMVSIQLATVLNTSWNEGMHWYPTILLAVVGAGNTTLAFMINPPIKNEETK